MSTRIKGPDGSAIDSAGRSRPVARTQSNSSGSSAKPAQPVNESGSVHITSAAHQLLALQQAISESPEVDIARVEQLRNDISQNRYQIDASRIADRLIQIEGDLSASGAKRDVGP